MPREVRCFQLLSVPKRSETGRASNFVEMFIKVNSGIFSQNFSVRGLQNRFICSKLWSKVMDLFPFASDIDIYIG